MAYSACDAADRIGDESCRVGAAVNYQDFDYDSMRACKARFANQLHGSWLTFLIIFGLLFVAAGLALLLLGEAFGWLIIGVGAVFGIPKIWYQRDLVDLAPSKDPETIDDIVASDVLGQLIENPTPKDIATAAGSVPSGQFFGARFGLSPRTLQEMASDRSEDASALWRKADEIRQQAGLQQITGGVLAVAITRLFPAVDGLLANLKLNDEDLVSGIHWQQHILDLVSKHGQAKMTGGIARDWSFGYVNHLSRFGQNISEQISRGGLLSVEVEAHRAALDQMIATFSQNGRQNIALVGPEGAGKTTLVHAFAEKLLDARANLPESLKYRQVYLLDASSLISAAPGRGELEGLVRSILGEAFAAKNIIICLDNAQLFFEENIGSVDLTNVLLPILEAGNLRVILTMDEQQLLRIGKRNSALINAINRVQVGEASREETIAVMQDQLIIYEFQRKVTYMYQALDEAYRLGARYLHDLAMPGKALKLLESAAGYSEEGLVTINSVQKAIEQTMNVKVSVASETEDREKLLNLESHIHERMINQSRAVQVVSDALRRARAGVRNENRPIGTFLFLGPTGVGKTELAKALAEVYFAGEDRMIRLDLNEFVRSQDVARLIADGAEDASSLTAQVMKQPFSVVLLDEIEKAHPAVLATLLQMLDEGILRDVKNREVSFRDAIVIATSNAGAERIREYIDRGYKLEQFETKFVDELISTAQFRPEFLNRFDEIVIFRPLEKPELLQVVDLMIAGINKTLSLQKVSVVVEDKAKELLVDRGYDPRLGARPMRRVVQRAVENTVAKQMLAGAVEPGGVIEITYDQVETILGSAEAAKKIIDENVVK